MGFSSLRLLEFFFLYILSCFFFFFSVTMTYIVIGMLMAMAFAVAGEQKTAWEQWHSNKKNLDFAKLQHADAVKLANKNLKIYWKDLRAIGDPNDERHDLVMEIHDLDQEIVDLAEKRFELASKKFRLDGKAFKDSCEYC